MRRRAAIKSPWNTGIIPYSCAFTIGAEASEIINVALQLKDVDVNDLTVKAAVRAFLSDDALGNSLVAYLPNGGIAIGTDGVIAPCHNEPTILLKDGNLAIHSTPEQFVTGQAMYYRIGGVQYTKAATTALTFTAAHTITASKFGIILLQINAAGTISSKVPAATQAYNTAALALAAIPAPDAGNVAIGHIAIANNAGDWVANTDDLTDASDLTTAAFVDYGEIGASSKVFDLISEDDGDIDLNITHVGPKTLYLGVQLPGGEIAMSGAITFA